MQKANERVRYLVFFRDCEGEFYYSTFSEADHTARLNAGVIIDLDKDEIVSEYGYGEEE